MGGMATNVESLLTAADVAAWIQVHEKTVYLMASDGRLPACRLGRRCIRFRREDVERLIADRLSGAMP